MIAREKRLVFISAGDHHQIHPTLNGKDAPFDVLVAFYGASASVRTELEKRGISVRSAHGSKFQNLESAFNSNPRLFDPYDAVFVLDDDLSLDANEVAGLFDFRQQHDFWIVQPAFRWGSSLGDQYSRCNPLLRYRCTNFVEVNAPLFRADKLKQFMLNYDGSLVGWGIDMWYMNLFEEGTLRRFAICDEISTLNPFSRSGVGWREIDRLQGQDDRRRDWERVRRERRLKQIVPRTYPGPRRDLMGAAREVIRLASRLFALALTDDQVRRSELRYLKGATKRLLRDSTAGVTARIFRHALRTGHPKTTLRVLARVWSNSGRRSSDHFIAALGEACRNSTDSVIEFGPGLTTLILSALVGNDRTIFALEKDATWIRRLKRRFLIGCVRNVELFVGTPGLESKDDPCISRVQLPDRFGLVVVRPRINDLADWSDELPEVLVRRIDENTVILIDSVEEPEARALADNWAGSLDRVVESYPKDAVVETYASLAPPAIDHGSVQDG